MHALRLDQNTQFGEFHLDLYFNPRKLTRRVLLAQFDDPIDGDFAQLVRDDFEMVQETLDMNMKEHTSEEQFKASVKANIRKAAIKHLNQLKESQSPMLSCPF